MSQKIAIVGDFWSAEDAAQRAPFTGAAGWNLNKMFDEASIHRADCFMTNVFNIKAYDIEHFCGAKTDQVITSLNSLKAGRYIRSEFLPELMRLQTELKELNPNIIVPLGAAASWYFTGSYSVKATRGTVIEANGKFAQGKKILPTYHPVDVQRDWSLRPVTVLDLAKAKREAEFPEIRRPERIVYIEPSLEEMEWYFAEYLLNARAISFDIETRGDQITCIGFAPDHRTALVVPFTDSRVTTPGNVGSYWPTTDAEILAWGFVRRVLSLPQPKFGQNTLYDINFLWVKYGITVTNYSDDTMLCHHALQPESLKGLGFLGSVYTNESSWKLLNRRTATIKRDA